MDIENEEFTDVKLIYGNEYDGVAFRTEKEHIITRGDDEGGVYISPSMFENHPTRLFLIQKEGVKLILTPIKLCVSVANAKEVPLSTVEPSINEEITQVEEL